MTVNRAVLAVLAIVYLMLGSIHEELRLRRAYGAHYETYQASSVPYLLAD